MSLARDKCRLILPKVTGRARALQGRARQTIEPCACQAIDSSPSLPLACVYNLIWAQFESSFPVAAARTLSINLPERFAQPWYPLVVCCVVRRPIYFLRWAIQTMRARSVAPDEITYSSAIAACGNSGEAQRAMDLLQVRGAVLLGMQP